MDIKYLKDPRENLLWRSEMLTKSHEDPIYKESLKRLFHEDIIFAFNAFFFTYDPRPTAPMPHLPFATYPFQDDAILNLVNSIRNGKDVVWEKSRDMGATWIICLTILWFWLSPEPGNDFLLGSRKEVFVDSRGDMSTLFPKLRYVIEKLPKWLVPEGYNVRLHDSKLKLINPKTGSVLSGESNNAQFSTGGRYRGVFYDEFSKWKDTDIAAWTSGAGATLCRIAIGTPCGVDNKYYDVVTNGKTDRTTLLWVLHPVKSKGLYCVWPPPNEASKGVLGDKWKPEEKLKSPWYEKEELRYSKEEMEQEVNIGYLGSGSSVFDGVAFDYIMTLRQLEDKPVAYYILSCSDFSYEEISERPENENLLVVYMKPNVDHDYVISADIVEGVEGGDFACVIVYDRQLKSVAATYYSRLDEILMASIIKVIYDIYSHGDDERYEAPWVAIETTGPGLSTFDKIVDYDIGNLFMAPKYDIVNGGVTYKKGWRTNTSSKNALISGIKEWLIDQAGAINSQRLVGELLTFVRSTSGNRVGAKRGCHDDMVIAFGIAIQVDMIAPSERIEILAEGRSWHQQHIPTGDDNERTETKTVTEKCTEQARTQSIFNDYSNEEY